MNCYLLEYLYLGDAYTENGDIDKALEAYEQALEFDPTLAPAANQ